ncbi:phosphomethylpyrimidine kinase [Aedoeadaptatus nemausensis]|uniref:Hydroxymethylpyrimidine/phosphomethylpyrimidine kinase n=1 Tax=Aedoeadaptatus nemausensis TaxID=2582829 RepID=A0A6V6Y479_9FIRM|nr:bifunctional hydroxymethylpyrimidine kinase/phosphomethylpyrimidine kinase [Peptoniphilus nemausensis]CAC9931917.1 phosphomethylpyrimidine kinase [Peptoniphilus nemausensis]
MKTMMTIAGSDSSGGAGIQADIKTATVLGVFATSAITSITAQNTTGVKAVYDLSPEAVASQMTAIMEDIPPDAVKIGMVSSEKIIKTIADNLKDYEGPVVLDPVMVATSGSPLLKEEAEATLKEVLMPIATLVTPNIPEAERLISKKITTIDEQIEAAKKIAEDYDVAALVKGGHGLGDAVDILYDGEVHRFKKPMLDNPNTHGTGCTLSSAITSHLALGYSPEEAVKLSKEYVFDAIADGLNLGHGHGPINHMVRR